MSILCILGIIKLLFLTSLLGGDKGGPKILTFDYLTFNF